MARTPIRLTVLIASCALGAPAQELTEKRALELLREGPHYRELQAGVAVARAEARRHAYYPNPTASATLEGAGRTDFFMVEQPLSLNGRRTLLRMAGESAVAVAETRAEHALRQIEARLRAAFYDLLFAQERAAVASEGVDAVARLAGILREREEAGEGSKFDRLRAERELAEQRSELAEAEVLKAEARARLAAFLGDRADPGTLAAAGTLAPGYGLPPLAEALAEGLEARSDYRVEAQRLEQLRLEGEAADRLRIPNPVVAGGLKRAELGDRTVQGPVVSVSVNLPVFGKGQVEKGLAEAEADRSRARRRVIESQILAEVRAAHDALRMRRRIAREYREEAGERARELLRIAEVAYREDETGIFDLLDALQVSQRTRMRALELQATAKFAEVAFDRSVAREPPG